jgi:hypothetical protein
VERPQKLLSQSFITADRTTHRNKPVTDRRQILLHSQQIQVRMTPIRFVILTVIPCGSQETLTAQHMKISGVINDTLEPKAIVQRIRGGDSHQRFGPGGLYPLRSCKESLNSTKLPIDTVELLINHPPQIQ